MSWFPDHYALPRAAVRICGQCEVRKECRILLPTALKSAVQHHPCWRPSAPDIRIKVGLP